MAEKVYLHAKFLFKVVQKNDLFTDIHQQIRRVICLKFSVYHD